MSKAISTHLSALRYSAPVVVTISYAAARSGLVNFLANIRRHFKQHSSRTLLIDFSRTERFVADGTLLLFAELSRLVSLSDYPVKLRCTEPTNVRASEVLKQVGIYRLCSSSSKVQPVRDDVVHWRVAQGTIVDNSLCAQPIEGFQGKITAEIVNELMGGLAEAMTNAIHHAYDDARADGLDFRIEKNWWMFSQEKDGHLSVVFCDLGIGIPSTLPLKRPALWERLLLLKSTPSDSDCIREAVREGASRTGEAGRGYGLGDIVNVVNKIPDGMVHVFSNRGHYSSRAPDASNDFDESILGTLIFWKVPLASQLQKA